MNLFLLPLIFWIYSVTRTQIISSLGDGKKQKKNSKRAISIDQWKNLFDFSVPQCQRFLLYAEAY